MDPMVLEYKIFKCCQCLFAISLLSPLYETRVLPFKSPSPKDTLYQVLVEVGQMVLEKKVLNVLNVFLLFRYYLSLEKGVSFH